MKNREVAVQWDEHERDDGGRDGENPWEIHKLTGDWPQSTGNPGLASVQKFNLQEQIVHGHISEVCQQWFMWPDKGEAARPIKNNLQAVRPFLNCEISSTLLITWSGARHWEPSTTLFSCHGVFTDRSIFSLNLSRIQISTETSVTNCNRNNGLILTCRHVHVRPHCFMLTEACSCRLELAYFAGKMSKNRLVCKNVVALAYHGSCRLLVMGSCLPEFPSYLHLRPRSRYLIEKRTLYYI